MSINDVVHDPSAREIPRCARDRRGHLPLAGSAKGRRFDQSAAARCSAAAATAGRLDSRNMRIWRTASGTLSGVSFHG